MGEKSRLHALEGTGTMLAYSNENTCLVVCSFVSFRAAPVRARLSVRVSCQFVRRLRRRHRHRRSTSCAGLAFRAPMVSL